MKLTCVLILRKLSQWSLILIILINGCILCFHLSRCLVANCHLWPTLSIWVIITEHTLHDDSDISRELRCLSLTRTNVLIRRFWRCSLDVKLRVFRTYCMCFYYMSLWKYYKVGSINKLAAAYIKCIQIFFGYAKFSSVTVMLLDLGLPCFSTLHHNARFRLSLPD